MLTFSIVIKLSMWQITENFARMLFSGLQTVVALDQEVVPKINSKVFIFRWRRLKILLPFFLIWWNYRHRRSVDFA